MVGWSADAPLVWAPSSSRRERRAERRRQRRRRRIRQAAAALGAMAIIAAVVVTTTTLMHDETDATRVAGREQSRDRDPRDEPAAIADPSTTTVEPTESTGPDGQTTTSVAPGDDGSAAVIGEAATATRPSIRMIFSGDITPHDPLVARAAADGRASGEAYDFTRMFARIAPIVSAADVAVCHLDSPVSPDNSKVSGFPTFNAPRELLTAISGAGYDGCSLASNHAMDAGVRGVGRTLDAMDAAGLRHTGTARDASEAAAATTYTVRGVTIAHLSYVYGLNGLKVPTDKPWLVNLIDEEKMLADAHRARTAGADIVVVSMHCCTEYKREPTPRQVDVAKKLLESGDVDLVVGHHAHLVSPLARVGGRVVAYGLGNLLTNQSADCCPPETQDGMLLDVTFSPVAPSTDQSGTNGWTPTTVGAHPTWVDRAGGYVVIPVQEALADPATDPKLRPVLSKSLERTTAALESKGLELDPIG